MRFPKHTYLIVFLFLFGCATPTQTLPTFPPPTQRSVKTLPPTWTLTASVQPSETPVRPATLTFTPLPSVTPQPSTLTPSPTSDHPTPTATATLTPTQITGCLVTALEEGVVMEIAPFYDPHRLRPTMEPVIPYQAVTESPTYWEVMRDGESVGWVDYRLVTIDIQGPECDNLPIDTREFTEFPGLCFFTPDGNEIPTYNDSELNEPRDTISGTGSYVISAQLENAYFTIISHAGPSFYVESSQVRSFGDCDGVPKSATIIADGWLWSQPDGQTGEQIGPLTSGTRVYIQEGPINGPKPPDIEADGAWHLVLVGSREDNLSGWIWSSIFEQN